MESEYISRRRALSILHCRIGKLNKLLREGIIEYHINDDNSFSINKCQVEEYAAAHPKINKAPRKHDDSKEYVARVTAQKKIGCDKATIMYLVESGIIDSYIDDEGCCRVSRASLSKYIESLSN